MRRKRQLPFFQIASDRLSQRVFVRRKIQDIVNQLKCHSDIQTVQAQELLLLFARRAQNPAELRAGGKKEGGLAHRNIQVLLLGNIQIPVEGKLNQLSFNHLPRGFDQDIQHLELPFTQTPG